MFVGRTLTKGPRGESTALGAPVTTKTTPVLSASALQKAVTLNRVYARTIGWIAHTRQIALLLGLTNMNPDIGSFVRALANWQARNGMMPTGVLGPGEFYAMLTKNRQT